MKLWKGRFSKAATSSADEFNASIEFDQRLYKEDITGSIAHAKMLAKQGIIPQEDADLIVKTLKEILADIEAGKVEFTIESEDIHMNIESILTERIGDAGKKLHTARSRNDQIAVDIRLYLKKEIAETDHILGQLLDALAKLAKEHTDTVMPGYTHLQRAQPVTLAYHLLAYYQMFSRDRERFADCLKRVDRLPLGSGALAGTTYDTDRDFLAKELGMPKGIIVMQTEEGSPAMKNGIQPTDVITALDDSSVESVQDYMNILRKKKPGDTISVNLWRKWKNDYKETKITITLAKR